MDTTETNQTPVTPAPSARFTLSKNDGKKVLRGACYAVAGAVLTYLVSVMGNTNFVINGVNYTPMVVAVFSIVASAAKKFLDGHAN